MARELALPLERVEDILQDLDKHLTFLVRNEQQQVVWAYPVTVDKTPHRITFASGERLYAASMPFERKVFSSGPAGERWSS